MAGVWVLSFIVIFAGAETYQRNIEEEITDGRQLTPEVQS